MMSVRTRHKPYWLDRSPARRPSWDRHRGDLDVDVAIVGGGLAGCAIAQQFAAARVPVALFEAGRLGEGATAGAAGLLLHEPDASFPAFSAAYGLRAARHVWRAARRASLDFAALLRRLGIRCDLEARDAIRFTTDRSGGAKMLRREYEVVRQAGLEASWLPAAVVRRETGTEAVAGVKSRQSGQLDPFRACHGLAKAAAEKGAQIFERSAVQRIRAGRKVVEIRTAGGAVRAGTVVLASGLPTPDLKPLRRHFKAHHAYAVLTPPLGAKLRREAGGPGAILHHAVSPAQYQRWVGDDRLLFTGADQPEVAARRREPALVQRTGQLMYELSLLYPAISGLQPSYSWDVLSVRTPDGVPCLGPHRNFPHHLFALGFGNGGAGLAWLGARILLRHYLGEPERGDAYFAFSRLPR
jgi:glycine/D-amino acid oxidase-like deaminating enzyme